jgi:AraC family transcriptional regulator of adaptative response/methylated-DNA-[protein]-cysteine methyltransferase
VLGVTPKAYATAHRNKRVREELRRSGTVTEAIYGAGFNSNGRFYATSTQVLGMSPSEFRAGAANAEIKFAIGQSSLGAVLVAASDKGVCAILFGDNAEGLHNDLSKQFPRARLVGSDQAFERLAAKVIDFVEAPAKGLDLPLDIRGTAFQHRVWDALRRIPAGATASYADCESYRLTEVGARGCPRLRLESHRGGDPLSPRHRVGWVTDWLSRGH